VSAVSWAANDLPHLIADTDNAQDSFPSSTIPSSIPSPVVRQPPFFFRPSLRHSHLSVFRLSSLSHSSSRRPFPIKFSSVVIRPPTYLAHRPSSITGTANDYNLICGCNDHPNSSVHKVRVSEQACARGRGL
jgi:hypothetical protein